MSDGPVKLTEASRETEAATICGYLESCGTHATYDKGGVTQGFGWGFDPLGRGGPHIGRQEIVVRGQDLEAAREALAAAD